AAAIAMMPRVSVIVVAISGDTRGTSYPLPRAAACHGRRGRHVMPRAAQTRRRHGQGPRLPPGAGLFFEDRQERALVVFEVVLAWHALDEDFDFRGHPQRHAAHGDVDVDGFAGFGFFDHVRGLVLLAASGDRHVGLHVRL